MSVFRKATKSRAKLRMALIGPAGTGKTYSALKIARGLVGPSGRIAVIDTEHGSADKYADVTDFDSVQLDDFNPRAYIDMIAAAEGGGYDAVIIDSLSHAWSGKGGALDLVDKAAAKSRSNNTFTAWRDVTPLQNALVEKILGAKIHVIATMRSKVDYVLTPNSSGGLTPQKVGMAPIQREGMDYEFDVVGDLDHKHRFIVSKTRCRGLDGAVIEGPAEPLGEALSAWLSDGKATQDEAANRPQLASQADINHILHLVHESRMNDAQFSGVLARRGVSSVSQLNGSQAAEIAEGLNNYIKRKRAEGLLEEAPTVRDIAEAGKASEQEGEDDPFASGTNEPATNGATAAAAAVVAVAPGTTSDPDDFTIPNQPRRLSPEVK